jgi:hypothetical protein
MSSAPNHRRGHGRIQGNGPRWENPNPEKGCNSSHVARSRRKWKRRKSRKERRKLKRIENEIENEEDAYLVDFNNDHFMWGFAERDG